MCSQCSTHRFKTRKTWYSINTGYAGEVDFPRFSLPVYEYNKNFKSNVITKNEASLVCKAWKNMTTGSKRTEGSNLNLRYVMDEPHDKTLCLNTMWELTQTTGTRSESSWLSYNLQIEALKYTLISL